MYIYKLENIFLINVILHIYYNKYICPHIVVYIGFFRLHVEAPTLPVQGSRMEYRSPQGFSRKTQLGARP